LLDHMRIEATIHVRRAEPSSEDDTPPWVLDIQGHDLGILIGRRGETLNALQYITRLICNRELQRRANIVVDVQGYKLRREATLRSLAERLADDARRRSRVVTLEPMPPNERRIIHLALRNNPHVTTESVGMGDKRKVTIIPVGQARR
jgi:spoIIIJ-associated protein